MMHLVLDGKLKSRYWVGKLTWNLIGLKVDISWESMVNGQLQVLTCQLVKLNRFLSLMHAALGILVSSPDDP